MAALRHQFPGRQLTCVNSSPSLSSVRYNIIFFKGGGGGGGGRRRRDVLAMDGYNRIQLSTIIECQSCVFVGLQVTNCTIVINVTPLVAFLCSYLHFGVGKLTKCYYSRRSKPIPLALEVRVLWGRGGGGRGGWDHSLKIYQS